MEFTFSPRAWEPEGIPVEPRTPGLGLHVGGRFDAVFDLEECLLPGPRFTRVVEETRGFVRERRWTGYSTQHDSGLLRHLVVREGQNTGDLLVALVTRRRPALADLGPSSRNIPGLTGVVLLVSEPAPSRAAPWRTFCGGARFGAVAGLTFELTRSPSSNERRANRSYALRCSRLVWTVARPALRRGTMGWLADRSTKYSGSSKSPGGRRRQVKRVPAGSRTPDSKPGTSGQLRSVDPGTFDVVVVDPPRAGLLRARPLRLRSVLRLVQTIDAGRDATRSSGGIPGDRTSGRGPVREPPDGVGRPVRR
jgi:23S rRNA (uracil1939-C5)-methyltransferase